MTYRNKTYVIFDADTDMRYYRLMTAWKANDGFDFNFHNAHDLNIIRDGSEEASIKRQLRERFANSKQIIVLIGEKTKYLRKFVPWEIEVALRLGLPIIAVNLNGQRSQDDLCPAVLRNELAIYIPYSPQIMDYATTHWPSRHKELRSQGVAEARQYKDSVYKGLAA